MRHLKYLMSTECTDGISGHPQKVMKDLGVTYQHATPQSLGDQWWFWNCENVPDNLPSFIVDLNLDPMECIGFGLSEDMAKKIRDCGSQS